jgi:hypothetical protein
MFSSRKRFGPGTQCEIENQAAKKERKRRKVPKR